MGPLSGRKKSRDLAALLIQPEMPDNKAEEGGGGCSGEGGRRRRPTFSAAEAPRGDETRSIYTDKPPMCLGGGGSQNQGRGKGEQGIASLPPINLRLTRRKEEEEEASNNKEAAVERGTNSVVLGKGLRRRYVPSSCILCMSVRKFCGFSPSCKQRELDGTRENFSCCHFSRFSIGAPVFAHYP